jgi:two-component system chemotaxis sensor kinase CheA
LPLTLAVIDGLVARVGRQRYIIPTTSIEQSLRPKDDQLSTIHGRGEACLVRGQLLPIYRLHRLFEVAGAVEDPRQALVVIIQDRERRCCLLVDELLGQQQVVIKSLGEGIGHTTGISGGAILGDGTVSMILDVPGLMELAAE